MARREETEAIRRKLMGFVQANGGGGTVQRRRGPDAWAVLVALALVVAGLALGLVVSLS